MSVDSLRFDCISREREKKYLRRYGVEDLPDTPNMNWFAENGVQFSQAITIAPYTSSSNASLFTGMYPSKHKCRANFYSRLSPHVPTLAETLKKNGYKTFHFLDVSCMLEYLDINRGVDFFMASDHGPAFNGGNDQNLFTLLNQHKEENIYLFVQFIDVNNPYGHSPYEIYPGYNDDYFKNLEILKERFFKDDELPDDRKDKYYTWKAIKRKMYQSGYVNEIFSMYIRGINKFDNGRFRWFIENLKNLGLLDDTLLIILSDHGEMDLGFDFSHGDTTSDEVIRVPLIMYYPSLLPKGAIIKDQVSLVDVMPTILDIAKIPTDNNQYHGRNLLPLIRGEETGTREAYSEIWSYEWEKLSPFLKECRKANRLLEPDFDVFLKQKSLRTSKFKYIVRGNNELTHLNDDKEFIKWLCREIWGRFENEDDMNEYLPQLQNGNLTREDLIEIFLNNPAAKARHMLFDLEKDPFEKQNLLEGENAKQYLSIASKLLDRIEELSLEDMPVEQCSMSTETNKAEDKEEMKQEPSQLNSAIWFLTWRCNNRCPYCWEVQRQARGEFKPEGGQVGRGVEPFEARDAGHNWRGAVASAWIHRDDRGI
jgi:arylsulfatase A-like enzyme